MKKINCLFSVLILFAAMFGVNTEVRSQTHSKNTIEVRKNHRSKSFHEKLKVRVEYLSDGKAVQIKGKIISIQDSAFVVRTKHRGAGTQKYDSVQIDPQAVIAISMKRLVKGTVLMGTGGMLLIPGVYIMVKVLANPINNIVEILLVTMGGTLCLSAVPVILTGAIISATWKEFKTSKGWEVHIKNNDRK